jgi:hypothetical protein
MKETSLRLNQPGTARHTQFLIVRNQYISWPAITSQIINRTISSAIMTCMRVPTQSCVCFNILTSMTKCK